MLSSFLLVPLLFLIILNLPLKIMQKIAFWCAMLLVAGQAYLVLAHPAGFWDRTDDWANFFKLKLFADNLTYVLLLSIGIVVFTSLFVAWQTIEEPKRRMNFVSLMLIALIGMNGTVLLTDIFSLYVFLEVTAVASFILIAFQCDLKALEGAFKYIILSALATMLILAAIAALMLFSGDSSFASVSEAVKNNNGNVIIVSAIAVFLCGLFVKAGLVPFHAWLPDAHSAAPTAVSIFLSGVQIKALGAYTIIRLVTSVFGWTNSISNLLLLAGVVSIVIGAFGALAQHDFKRMLAYSSVSNMGYIILGFGCGSPIGIAGAIFHMFNHSVFKSLLFTNAAAVYNETHTTDMDQMGGLGAKMPISNATSLVGILSAAGVPPTAGFWSKLIIIMALWQGEHYVYVTVAILVAVLTLAYLLVIQRKVFFGILPEHLQNTKEAGIGIVLPAVILAAIIIGVGLFFPVMFNSFMIPIDNFLK
ncbi:MAG: proton-conducting transporter membrane subunit [Sedimentisphaerales bacterium]